MRNGTRDPMQAGRVLSVGCRSGQPTRWHALSTLVDFRVDGRGCTALLGGGRSPGCKSDVKLFV